MKKKHTARGIPNAYLRENLGQLIPFDSVAFSVSRRCSVALPNPAHYIALQAQARNREQPPARCQSRDSLWPEQQGKI